MKRNRKSPSLKFNILVNFLVIAFGLNFVIAGISFSFYNDTIKSESNRTSIGMTNSIASGINGNRVNDWIYGKRMEEYSHTKNEVINFVKASDEIEKITVAKMLADDILILFEVGDNLIYGRSFGMIPYSTELEKVKNDLLYGYQIEPIKFTKKGESYIMSLTPVKSSDGDTECYVICEISLGGLEEERALLVKALAAALSISTALAILAYLYLNSILVAPLRRIDAGLDAFADDNKLAEKTRSILLDKKQNRIRELENMNKHFVELIDDVSTHSEQVDDFGNDVIKNVSNMVNLRNVSDTSNIDQIKDYTLLIIENLRRKRKYKTQITDMFTDAMITAVPLYDLGELLVSDDILNKNDSLTEEEYAALKKHTEDGVALVDDVIGGIHDEYYVQIAKDMAQYHHEKWNGSGYMAGLKGKEIPLAARIIAVPDVFNALISDKTYRKGKTIEEAFDIIKKGRKVLFDKDVVDAFFQAEKDIRRIAGRYSHSSQLF